jgi:hypothetical protein
VLVDGVPAQVVDENFGQPFILRPLHDGMGEGANQQLGQAGEDVDTHTFKLLAFP